MYHDYSIGPIRMTLAVVRISLLHHEVSNLFNPVRLGTWHLNKLENKKFLCLSKAIFSITSTNHPKNSKQHDAPSKFGKYRMTLAQSAFFPPVTYEESD